MLYLGLHMMQMMFGNVVESLIQLIERGIGSDLFGCIDAEIGRSREQILLYKIFDLCSKTFMYSNSQLEKEYCCFYHFLTGKRRVMEKSNKINVS